MIYEMLPCTREVRAGRALGEVFSRLFTSKIEVMYDKILYRRMKLLVEA